MKLNKKQKQYLFTEMLDEESLMKIFETTNVEYLCKLKVEIKEADSYGWRPLYVEGIEQTSLNFAKYGENWNEVLNNIEEWEQCQWCQQWYPKDEMVFRKRGFTKLCDKCNDYLIGREGI